MHSELGLHICTPTLSLEVYLSHRLMHCLLTAGCIIEYQLWLSFL